MFCWDWVRGAGVVRPLREPRAWGLGKSQERQGWEQQWRALDLLLLMWTAACWPCTGPTVGQSPPGASPTRLWLSVYQKALHSFRNQSTMLSWLLGLCCRKTVGGGAGGLIPASAGTLRLRKVKKLASHPWMAHWLPEYVQSISGQRSWRREIGSQAQPWMQSLSGCSCMQRIPILPVTATHGSWTATLWAQTPAHSFPRPLGHFPACSALRSAQKFRVSGAEVGKPISWWRKSSLQVLKIFGGERITESENFKNSRRHQTWQTQCPEWEFPSGQADCGSTSLATDPSHSFQDGLHAVFLQTMDNLNLVTRTYQTNPKGHSTKPKPLAVLFEAVSNMKDIERQGDILG